MYDLRSNTDAKSKAYKVNNLSNYTSYSNIRDQSALQLRYKDVADIRDLNIQARYQKDSPLYINDREYTAFAGCSTINYKSIHDISDDEKQFAMLLDQVVLNEAVVRGTDESKTDTFIDYVIREIGLGRFPLAIRLKPVYTFRVRHKTISSEYGFSVEKQGRLLMIEEDKHIRNTGPGSSWGEYQIAGEIIAGAIENYVKLGTSGDIFSVRAMPRFTSYHTVVPVTYIASLDIGLPDSSVVIRRYPPQNDRVVPGLDYTDPKERRDICTESETR